VQRCRDSARTVGLINRLCVRCPLHRLRLSCSCIFIAISRIHGLQFVRARGLRQADQILIRLHRASLSCFYRIYVLSLLAALSYGHDVPTFVHPVLATRSVPSSTTRFWSDKPGARLVSPFSSAYSYTPSNWCLSCSRGFTCGFLHIGNPDFSMSQPQLPSSTASLTMTIRPRSRLP
jgi:hypothetical protein